MRPKLLFLFPECWDRSALRGATPLRDEFEVLSEGFDLFRFPENARLLWLDARAYIDRLVHRYRRAGIAGVVSTNAQYGALIAARLARELGLPGTDPLAVVRGQHKILARQRCKGGRMWRCGQSRTSGVRRRGQGRALPDGNPLAPCNTSGCRPADLHQAGQ